MPIFVDISCAQFGRLTAVERAPSIGRYIAYRFRCECGNEVVRRADSVKSGLTTSCGCYFRETRGLNRTHGQSETSLYNVWLSAKRRCHSPSVAGYKNYGARCIYVCERWRTS